MFRRNEDTVDASPVLKKISVREIATGVFTVITVAILTLIVGGIGYMFGDAHQASIIPLEGSNKAKKTSMFGLDSEGNILWVKSDKETIVSAVNGKGKKPRHATVQYEQPASAIFEANQSKELHVEGYPYEASVSATISYRYDADLIDTYNSETSEFDKSNAAFWHGYQQDFYVSGLYEQVESDVEKLIDQHLDSLTINGTGKKSNPDTETIYSVSFSDYKLLQEEIKEYLKGSPFELVGVHWPQYVHVSADTFFQVSPSNVQKPTTIKSTTPRSEEFPTRPGSPVLN